MDIKIGEFVLYSRNPVSLFQFLSNVFEVQADVVVDQTIKFNLSGVSFLIVKTELDIAAENYFSLMVGCVSELKELAQTIEFYYFRTHCTDKTVELCDRVLTFTDPDGRKWTVKEKFFEPFQVTTEHQLLDVRNC
ncbi:MAG: hypothetical protein HON90_06315 [Halobacteriovoraceae bacterium]|jgi:hypothetical protein|nr:hypothetical protein [Halobacteriovoraceae bacterium]